MNAAYVKIGSEYYSPSHPLAKAHAQSMGRVADTKPKPNQVRALDRKPSARKGRKRGVVIVVSFIPYVSRPVDSDNFGSGPIKPLRDAVADSLKIDDGDSRIKWEYHEPIVTRGACGVQVLISRV